LLLEGRWGGCGVKNTEDASFDARIFLAELARKGLPWTVKTLKDLPPALKQEY